MLLLGVVLAACAPLPALAGTLAKVGERDVAAAVVEGAALVLFANRGAGTWTIVARAPDGRACVAATGRVPPKETT